MPGSIVAGRWKLEGDVDKRVRLRKVIVDARITFHARDVGTRRQCFGDFTGSLHKDCVNDVERAVLKPTLTQPLQDWPLSRLRLVEKGLEHEPSLLGLRLQVRGRSQIGLVSQHNEKFRLLTIGSVFHDPRRNLA